MAWQVYIQSEFSLCATNCRTIGAYWQDSRMWQPIGIACKWLAVGAGLRQLPSQPAPLSIPTSDVTHWIVSIIVNTLCGVHIKVSYIKQASYLHRRGAVYQYIRRVPCDIRPYYKTNQLYFSLRTTSLLSANRIAKSITQKLDDYWLGIRLRTNLQSNWANERSSRYCLSFL